MAIGAGGGIMAGPMGNPMGNQQPVAAPPVMNEEPMMSDSGEDMAQVQNEEAMADTGQLAQALSNVSPDAKESLTNITKGQADAMTQVLANLGINPEESNAVFSKFGVGKESGLIIPTAEVMENPEGVKSKIDQFVMAMSNQADSGMMTSNTPSGVDEANMTNRVPPTQPV